VPESRPAARSTEAPLPPLPPTASLRAGDGGTHDDAPRPDAPGAEHASVAIGGPWPRTAAFGAAGLTIGGIAASELAARHGTPLLVVDEDDLRARCLTLRASFPHVLYAVKAFTSHTAIRLMVGEGIDLLVSTEGELDACLRAGVAAHHLVLHGNNKSNRELELAVSSGCRLVVVDNVGELERLERIARARALVQGVLVRVIPEVEARTHPAVETGAAGSKFGTPLADASAAIRTAASLPGLRYEGIHAHVGSQVLRPQPYVEVVDRLFDVLVDLRRTDGIETRILDVGGGFGVTYTHEAPLGIAELASRLSERVRSRAEVRGVAVPELLVEPGRALVANAGVTLYRVGSVKDVAGGPRLVAVDGGMSDNIRPMLYGARFTVAPAGPIDGGVATRCTVVGKHCESGDVLAEDVELPARLAPGALIAFAATGAYTYSMASNYNRIGRPAVVAVGGGRTTPWLRREDSADMDRLEIPTLRHDPVVRVPDGVEVRPAAPGDAASFVEMWREVVSEQRYTRSEDAERRARFYRRRFKRSWTNDEAQIVAVAGRRVVGHVNIQRESHPGARHVATLGIAVASDRRGGGVGSALLAEAVRWARGAGVEKIVLSVYPHNSAAIALYRKFGFVEEGRMSRQSRKSYGYEDELLMARFV
jgi:diaminopimelate decarboxylase